MTSHKEGTKKLHTEQGRTVDPPPPWRGARVNAHPASHWRRTMGSVADSRVPVRTSQASLPLCFSMYRRTLSSDASLVLSDHGADRSCSPFPHGSPASAHPSGNRRTGTKPRFPAHDQRETDGQRGSPMPFATLAVRCIDDGDGRSPVFRFRHEDARMISRAQPTVTSTSRKGLRERRKNEYSVFSIFNIQNCISKGKF